MTLSAGCSGRASDCLSGSDVLRCGSDLHEGVDGPLLELVDVGLLFWIMACPNVFNAFAVATESLAQDVYKRASYRSMWLNMIERGEYPQGTGLTQTSFTTTSIEPTAAEEWSAITLATGDNGGACDVTYNDVPVGYNAVTWSPERFALKGPLLCKDDLTFDHRVEAFLRVYLEKLSIRAQRSWETRYQNLFAKFAIKAVADSSFTQVETIPAGVNEFPWIQTGSTGQALNQATSELTQEMLDVAAATLIRNGATNPDSSGFISYSSDGPVFPLYIGLEASQRIAQNNPAFREDLRYADMGSGTGAELLKRIGANRVIKNFRHVPNLFPPRFTYGGGKYTLVQPFTSSSGTKGTVFSVNPSWVTAQYEGAFIVTPYVFKSHIVRPVNRVGDLGWMPTNYMGEWQWVTGAYKLDVDCADPLEKKGQHYAEFIHAPEPIFANQGMTIIFRRCTGALTQIICS